MKRFFQLAVGFSTFSIVNSLDVILKDVNCNTNHPIYIEDNDRVTLECDGRNRCTFGEDALIGANFTFNGVDDIGLMDGYAFVSARLSFLTLDYELFNYMMVPLCGSYVTPDENNEYDCPGDGIYRTEIPYMLPKPDGNDNQWLATGWNGKGEISFYSESDNEDSLIGYCNLHLSTAVTGTGNWWWWKKPSAMMTTFVILGAVVLVMIAFVYSSCCGKMSRKKTKKEGDVSVYTSTAGSVAGTSNEGTSNESVSPFNRMV